MNTTNHIPTPPHSDDSTVPSSSIQTIINAPTNTSQTGLHRTPPTPSARQQVPGLATTIAPPPLPVDVEYHGSQLHLYNTPTFPADGNSAGAGNSADDAKKLAAQKIMRSTDPNDDVEIFSSEPIVVHVPKKTKDSASASSSITLLTGADAAEPGADGRPGNGRPGKPHPNDQGSASDRRRQRRRRAAKTCVWLAVGQLLCSVALTALGVLLWTRGATFAHGAAGLWSGAVCAIAGALGVINERTARTGFLAVSLICVATSTLAMALTGIGLVRDRNANENHGAVEAAIGLLGAMAVHFLISVLSVYNAAIQQCTSRRSDDRLAYLRHQAITNVMQANAANAGPSRSKSSVVHHSSHYHPATVATTLDTITSSPHSQLGDNSMAVYANGTETAPANQQQPNSSNPAQLSRQRVEQYFRSLPRDGTVPPVGAESGQSQPPNGQRKVVAKAASEMYAGMPMPVWTSPSSGKHPYGTLPPPSAFPVGARAQPVMLVPAGLHSNRLPMPPPPPPAMLFPPHLAPPGMMSYHPPSHGPPASSLGYSASLMRHPPHHHPHHIPHPHHPNAPHHYYPAAVDAALLHSADKNRRRQGRNDAPGGRRRKSEPDRGATNAAFVYTGLDRAIADSFLEQQERQNVDGDRGGDRAMTSGADVAM